MYENHISTFGSFWTELGNSGSSDWVNVLMTQIPLFFALLSLFFVVKYVKNGVVL